MKCDETFVNDYIGLVKNIAKRFMGRGTDFEDLVQIGCMGLVKASANFDESLGFKFSTYAVPVIMGEIKRFLRDDNYVKVSRKLKERFIKVNLFIEKYIKENGREPCLSEIEKETGFDKAEIIECLECDIKFSAFDNCLEDVLYCDSKEEEILDNILIKEIISKLDERSRKIVVLRYFKNKTQKEISEIIGVSQVQISRLEKQILKQLKQYIK